MPSSVDSTRTAFLVPSSNTSAPHLFPPPLPPPPRTPKHKKALRPLSNSRHSLCKGPPLPINQKQSNAHASSTDPLTEGDDLSSAEKQSKLNPPHRLADMSQKRESLFFASFVRPSRPVQSTHQREAVGGWGGGSPLWCCVTHHHPPIGVPFRRNARGPAASRPPAPPIGRAILRVVRDAARERLPRWPLSLNSVRYGRKPAPDNHKLETNGLLSTYVRTAGPQPKFPFVMRRTRTRSCAMATDRSQGPSSRHVGPPGRAVDRRGRILDLISRRLPSTGSRATPTGWNGVIVTERVSSPPLQHDLDVLTSFTVRSTP
ncbi:hypothetical protein PCL_00167 [Purpureocillium lilacinum]|uniref:Uncharacterized protein n=1 Tax=Purpureocillium lilacinum TaxID=33203 RepID=A0A2U3E6A1_PURLI|nr:hypothetical protein PCL_00167 [Purpureocillium lilacinum]